MGYIAHRGIWNNLKEANSLKALKEAIDNPMYIGLETDIRITKDQVYVLYHDPLFKGKLVRNINYEEMQKENIATLDSLLKTKTNKILLVEIKDFDMDLKKFITFLNHYKRNIYIMSFSTKVITNLKKITSKYKLGVLNYVLNTPNNYNYDFICLLNDILDDYIIDIFKNKNISIIGYGIRKNVKLKYNITYIIDSKYIK